MIESTIRVKNSGLVRVKMIRDDRDGTLAIIESLRDVPFDIRRVYFISNLEKSVSIRGKHAHKELEQIIFCIQGSFVLGLDDGNTSQKLLLNEPNVGIRLGKMLWHTMEDFSESCVLLVVASDYYDENDYIRDYGDFLKLAQGLNHD